MRYVSLWRPWDRHRYMADIPSIRDEVDAEARAWRADVTHTVLIVLVLVALPIFVCALLGTFFVLPWPQRWIGASAYGALVAALLIPRRYYRWRARIFLSTLYVLAIVQLATHGLAGDGRIALLALPLLALILLGTKAGWVATSITGVMLGAFTLLARKGMLAGWQDPRENDIPPGYRLLQALLLLGALIPLMVLFTRFLARQTQTAAAERRGRRKLQKESVRRRRLEDEITRIGEEERRRLGSELHDGLCQHLTAALLHCTAVENQLAEKNMPEAGSAARLRSLIEASIGMAYDVSKGLCPVDLDPEALNSALDRLARQTHGSAGPRCEFRNEGEVAIRDPQKALHLFRIAQEAVTNAVKHAQCQKIQIELLSAADSLTLRVQDDGVGWRGSTDGDVGGMGVPLMAHRADVIGGTLTIDNPAGGGTIVTCRVPAEAAKDRQA